MFYGRLVSDRCRMYLVGHAIVAFLIAYGISKKFKISGISFAFVMILATLADIDILFELAGITSHKTYTHSLILSVMIVPAIIFAISRWRKASFRAAAIYIMAYMLHIAIGDIVIGGTNILYPFGNLMIGTEIGYGTVIHQAIEFILLAATATIIVSKSFRIRSSDLVGLFRFENVDKASYALFLASLVVSFAYLLYGIKVLPRLFIQTNLELALFVMLHLAAIALISFLMLVARQHTNLHKKMVKSQQWFGGREPDKL
jgi:hypothetical protein